MRLTDAPASTFETYTYCAMFCDREWAWRWFLEGGGAGSCLQICTVDDAQRARVVCVIARKMSRIFLSKMAAAGEGGESSRVLALLKVNVTRGGAVVVGKLIWR